MKMRVIASFIVVPVVLAAALAVPRAQRGAPAATRGHPADRRRQARLLGHVGQPEAGQRSDARAGHDFRPQQVPAVQAGRRGVLRAAHRRSAARRAARVLHAVRLPVGVPRTVSGPDGPERRSTW